MCQLSASPSFTLTTPAFEIGVIPKSAWRIVVEPVASPSSVRTMRFRLEAMFQGRRAMPVEAFPWTKAWNQHVVLQSIDSQHGVAGALRGFLAHCRDEGLVKKVPAPPAIKGRKRRGKPASNR
jgi:hypothetical protein